MWQFSIIHFAVKQQDRDSVSRTETGMKGCKALLEQASCWWRQSPGDFCTKSSLVQMQIVTGTYLNWFSWPLPRINNHKQISLQIKCVLHIHIFSSAKRRNKELFRKRFSQTSYWAAVNGSKHYPPGLNAIFPMRNTSCLATSNYHIYAIDLEGSHTTLWMTILLKNNNSERMLFSGVLIILALFVPHLPF